jgi:hypothetical protein
VLESKRHSRRNDAAHRAAFDGQCEAVRIGPRPRFASLEATLPYQVKDGMDTSWYQVES